MKTSILLTGATGNLGSAVWRELVAANYHILATIRSAEQKKLLQHEEVEATVLDLTDEAAVKTYVETIKENQDVAAAILLVGGFSAGSISATDGNSLRKMFMLNVETTFYLVRELTPIFEKRGGGKFILIGSRAALEPKEGKNEVAYALSKQLIFNLAEIINADGKDKGIDATVIVPSTIDTPINRKNMPEADFSKWVSPAAIAETIRFVLSDAGQQMRQSVLKLYHDA